MLANSSPILHCYLRTAPAIFMLQFFFAYLAELKHDAYITEESTLHELRDATMYDLQFINCIRQSDALGQPATIFYELSIHG